MYEIHVRIDASDGEIKNAGVVYYRILMSNILNIMICSFAISSTRALALSTLSTRADFRASEGVRLGSTESERWLLIALLATMSLARGKFVLYVS